MLVLSFVALAALWPTPRMQGELPWRALPPSGGCWARARSTGCAGCIGVALLVVVVLAGYLGSGTALNNLAPTFILITFWVGLMFASVLFGDVFRAVQPVAGDRPARACVGRGRGRRLPGAAGALAGRGGAAGLHLDRARVGLGRAPGALVTAAPATPC